jgi:ABC-type lipoprotein release transport system permease subunit
VAMPAIAGVASALPARTAARVSPLEALRAE